MEEEQKPEDAEAQAAERRAGPRFEVDDDALLLLVSDGRQVHGRVLDLSLNGCRLRTTDRFNAGTGVRVEVTFRVNGIAFRFFGITQWTNEWNVVGIQFVEVPQRRLRDLAEVVGEVEEEAAARTEMQAMEALSAELLTGEETTVGQATETGEAQGQERDQERAQERVWIHAVSNDHTSDHTSLETREHPAHQFAGFDHPDRRVQLRQAVETSAAIRLIPGGSRQNGLILELSLSGCHIRTDARFPAGIFARVEVEFHVQGLPFRLAGVIQFVEEKRLVGVKFLDMSERKKTQLAQLIGEIEANHDSGEVQKP